MWICPKCKARLVQTNLSHSCGSYSVDDFLKGKSERAIALFWFFVDAWGSIGKVTLHPVKTSVAIMHQVRFARINRITRDAIVGHLWLKSPIESKKFFRIVTIGPKDFLHHFRIENESFIDDEFLEIMQIAYRSGLRA